MREKGLLVGEDGNLPGGFRRSYRFLFLAAITFLEVGRYVCQETPSVLKDLITTVHCLQLRSTTGWAKTTIRLSKPFSSFPAWSLLCSSGFWWTAAGVCRVALLVGVGFLCAPHCCLQASLASLFPPANQTPSIGLRALLSWQLGWEAIVWR